MFFLSAFLFCLPTCEFQFGIDATEIVASSLVLHSAGRVGVYIPSGPLSCSHKGPTDASPSLLISHTRSLSCSHRGPTDASLSMCMVVNGSYEVGITHVRSLNCSHKGPTDADPSGFGSSTLFLLVQHSAIVMKLVMRTTSFPSWHVLFLALRRPRFGRMPCSMSTSFGILGSIV